MSGLWLFLYLSMRESVLQNEAFIVKHVDSRRSELIFVKAMVKAVPAP